MSMPPPPLPMSTPARGSPARRPASRHASRAAMTPNSAAREYRLRIGAAVSVLVALERRGIVDRDRRHPGRHLAGIGRDVELRDGLRAAAAAADVLPEPLAADAERRHDADAGDDDAGLCRSAMRGGHYNTGVVRLPSRHRTVRVEARWRVGRRRCSSPLAAATSCSTYAFTFGAADASRRRAARLRLSTSRSSRCSPCTTASSRGHASGRGWHERCQPELERSVYVWVASLLLIAVCALVAAAARRRCWSWTARWAWPLYGAAARRRLAHAAQRRAISSTSASWPALRSRPAVEAPAARSSTGTSRRRARTAGCATRSTPVVPDGRSRCRP